MRRFSAFAALLTLVLPNVASAASRGMISRVSSFNPDPGNHHFTTISAEGNLAVMASGSNGGVFIMDISNPAAPTLLKKWTPMANCPAGVCEDFSNEVAPRVPPPYNLDTYMDLHDAKIVGGYGYFASNDAQDCGQGSGVYLVDLRNPNDPATFGKVLAHFTDGARYGSSEGGTSKKLGVHTISLQKVGGQEYLYLAGIQDGEGYNGDPTTCRASNRYRKEVRIYRVTNKTAPVYVGTMITRGWVHDLSFLRKHVRGADRMFMFTSNSLSGCNGEVDKGCTEVWEIQNSGLPQRYKEFNTAAGTHSSSPTENGSHLFVTNELFDGNPAGQIQVWPLDLASTTPPTAPAYTLDPGQFTIIRSPIQTTVHETYVRGNRLFVTWYREGIAVFDIKNPISPVLLGSHRTTISTDDPTEHDGAADIFPFLGDDRILVSDGRNGLVVLSLNFANRVGSGSNHTLAIRDDGTLWAWGLNNRGQFGTGATSTTPTGTPVQVGSARDWVAVTAGLEFSLALKSNGTLYAWGANDQGQLGLGHNTQVTTPQPLPQKDNSKWVAVSANGLHALGLTATGLVFSWGYNGYGQLGNGSTLNQNNPGQACIPRSSECYIRYHAISTGSTHSLGVTIDKKVYAWGNNSLGQLGINEMGNIRPAPVLVSDVTPNMEVVSGGHEHTSFFLENNEILGSGDNRFGQLAMTSPATVTTPVREGTSASDWRTLSSGQWHSAAIKSNGTLWTWGYNNFGQLGNATGPSSDQFTPVREATLSTSWTYPYLRNSNSFGRKKDGTLYAWGNNASRQLGTATANSVVYAPTKTNWTANGFNVTVGSQTATASLSDMGFLDWTHWGLTGSTSFSRRPDVKAEISNQTKVGTGTTAQFTSSPLSVQWGTATATTTTQTGIRVAGVGNGFSFTVPASATPRSLKVYAGTDRAVGRLEVSMSNSSVANYSITPSASTTGWTQREFTINFASTAPGAVLTVKWIMSTSNGGYVYLKSAALNHKHD
jgi:alpha-tubulin suppressor-like RCC1 family protein